MNKSWARVISAGLLGSTLLAVAPASAHHSFAMYNAAVQYVFTGIVVRIAPSPDHQQIYFVPLNDERSSVVRNGEGQPIVWMMEMEGAAESAIQGVTVEGFPPGTIFSVGLNPLRNGTTGGTRGNGASQVGASVIFRCPPDVAPAPGMHCDSVEGSMRFGNGDLPMPTASWSP